VNEGAMAHWGLSRPEQKKYFRTNKRLQLPRLLSFMPEEEYIAIKISKFPHKTGIINRTSESSQAQNHIGLKI
jgi:hypothetical protein